MTPYIGSCAFILLSRRRENREPPQPIAGGTMHFRAKHPSAYSDWENLSSFQLEPTAAGPVKQQRTEDIKQLHYDGRMPFYSDSSGPSYQAPSSTITLFLHSPVSLSSLTLQQCSHFRAGTTNTRNLAVLPTLLFLYGLKSWIMAKRKNNSCEQPLVIYNGLLLPVLVENNRGHLHHSAPFMGCLKM